MTPLLLAIAGNPNSGKSTLFNRLTGLRQKVANYPGVTVEKKLGLYRSSGLTIQLLDLPGTYALSPQSEEERIASEILHGQRPEVKPLDGVLCLVDSTCLERSLYLVLQIRELGLPSVLLLNMSDELKHRGAEIDAELLSQKLAMPVISLSASQGTGVEHLEAMLKNWPVTLSRPQPPLEKDAESVLLDRRKKAKEIADRVFLRPLQEHHFSDAVDRVVMHRLWGPLIFSGVVLTVFQAIFSWAAPFMNLIDDGFSRFAILVKQILPEGLLSSFLADGVIAGVGSVVVFLPQILIVFFFIAVLEYSGYMARAAMVMDRFLERLGLQGKSFLPLISSYACAIPGIMATRTMESRRDRLATMLIAPFMTCSARLPVYALLIAAFVPNVPVIRGLLGLQALTLLGLYAVGFTAAAITALLLKSTILKSDNMPFLLEIPPYRVPPVRTIALLMWDRSKIFLKRASTLILGTAIVMWFLLSFPRTDQPVPIEESYAGMIGKIIEPLLKPLGFNWKIGIGLIAAQSAREVIISTLSTLYRVELQGVEGKSLQEALKADLTPLGAVSLMVFFALAMQCMSTLAILRKESGGWKMPVFVFFYMNACAYLASLLVFQGGRALGFT